LSTVWCDTPEAAAIDANVTSSKACSRKRPRAAEVMRSRVDATPAARAVIV
jgi:hypothetical protein